MSSENHGHSSSELLELLGRDVHEIHKQPRFSYTRDFLLSLSGLDICKKLPVGFDASLLSEFEDTSSNSLQQSRSQGGFYSQSSRRNEYGYTQTNRSETLSNHSRGSQGKWETRSSGSSDREELQIRDSSAQDTGKHNLNQPRLVWKQTEQDGLLGKPSGYSGHASSQRPRGNDLYTLNKSTEPYQPPRPYKAVSHSWRDNSDSINDETFGLSDCSEDRAEEERKRRASFELMRKEQQKALQEKQKQTTDNLKEDLDAPLKASLKNPEGLLASRNKNDEDVNVAQLQSDSSKTVQTQLSSLRPRVPPGFRSASLMKNVSAPPSEMTSALEAKKSGSHIPPVLSKDTSVKSEVDSILETGGDVPSTIHTADSITMTLSNAMEKSSPVSRNSDPPSYQAFGPTQATEGWMDTSVHSDFINSQDKKTVVNVPSNQDHPKSLLDELFKNVDKQNDGDLSNFVEAAMHENESWNTTPFLTSRFSDWFPEEQRQPEEKYPSKDLFSQLFFNEKAKSEESLVNNEIAVENIDAIHSTIIPDEKDIENISSFSPFVSGAISNIVQVTEDCYTAVTTDASLSVLTCEDLEQSILAEANATIAAKSSPLPWVALDVKSEPSTDANDHASQHLRLLLHVGSEAQNLTSDFNVHTSEIFHSFGSTGTKNACTNDIFDTSEIGEHSSKGHSVQIPLVLEGLFPADVMKGLQSTEGPLSEQMGSADGGFKTIASQSHELPFSHPVHSIDDHLSPLNQEYDYVSANEVNELSRNPALSTHKVQEPWTGFKASNLDGISANGTFDINAAFKEIRLPEEKNLIGLGENLSSLIPDPFSGRNFSRHDEQLRLKSPDNIVEKLANLNPVYRNQRGSQLPGTEGSLPDYGSFELVESDPQYQQFPGRHAPFVHHSSQTGAPFQQHDPREFRNLHREFMAPDSVPYGPHHQFPNNIVHPQSFHNLGLQVDPSGQFQMLANMPVPGKFSSQELHGFPRGGPHSHPMNSLPQMQEMNPMHNFPTPHRQTNHDLGMEMPGIGIGNSSYANTLGRFFEMDARAARQTHPLAGSHLHGSYTTEVDLGFRYR